MQLSGAFKERLRAAEHLVFFTGAGISAESGIPTFRGKEGLWNKFRPEELASFNAFIKNPALVWEWYQYRRAIVQQAAPNAGHTAICGFERYIPRVTVITQNVDNLHRRAGSTEVYELHGNIERNYCLGCGKRYDYHPFPEITEAPRCGCGGLIRPDVVWFGEELPQEQYAAAEAAAGSADVFIVTGTSAVVYPAAFLPVSAARSGAFLVELNLEPSGISQSAHYTAYGKAGYLLPLLLEQAALLRQPL